ncbi:MAG: hypothetical protein Q8O13_03360 [Candidatus Omnitrophota bacterium]|nr:hypothetical protein [Candidatus Omnitrophota bacterium]
MSALLFGIMTFCFALFIHFIIWKVSLPKKNQTISLLRIFLVVFIINIFIFRKFSSVSFFGITVPQTLPEYLQFFLLYLSLAIAYITSYSAVEVDSPSFIIVLNIANSSPDGMDEKKLNNIMADEFLLLPRIKDLVNDKAIYFDNGKYKLTKKGEFMANMFIFFRKLLNAPKGG